MFGFKFKLMFRFKLDYVSADAYVHYVSNFDLEVRLNRIYVELMKISFLLR